MEPPRRVSLGAAILAVGALGMNGITFAFLAPGVDLTTRVGRHTLAGALANTSLTLLLAMIAWFPLRHGQRWAFWAFLIPVFLYGVPILVVDTTHVAPQRLLATLAPQVLGLLITVCGLVLVGPHILRRQGPPR